MGLVVIREELTPDEIKELRAFWLQEHEYDITDKQNVTPEQYRKWQQKLLEAARFYAGL